MIGFLRKLFDPNPREIKRLEEIVIDINELEPEFEALSDDELRDKTAEFRRRLDDGATLEDLLPEAFAAVREAAKRTVGMRHYDVQMVGGIALHEGRIAEMKTGEGKTLVATAPIYLNALSGKGVHLVTVNDYLATRDAEWMGPIYRALGMTVGTIVHGKSFTERREAYAADITYGTNNEFGFDYLRDNMVRRRDEMVQRPLNFAIVDEVDSILIDEARTPLIISGPGEESTEHYYRFAQLVPRLKREEHYTVDEKAKTVALTEEGTAEVEKMLGIDSLVDEENFRLNHYVVQALKAMTLFQRDRDYVVHDNGEVVIVDEFTGRLMFGRRYSDGLHQAIEAREGVRIERESQTLASITFQNYFRMYNKLSGMTGTAKTEEEEFRNIYGMDVLIIPTHRPMIRDDQPDLVYKTAEAKYRAVIDEIVACYERRQPVLVGTVSIDTSEQLSRELRRRQIPHNVLNAKHHDQEAEIVAQAGRKGAVTIATNMAGRGTDIVLGGNPEFLARDRMRRLGFDDEQIAEAAELYERREAAKGTGASTADVVQDADADVKKALEQYEAALAEVQEEAAAAQEEVLELGGLHIIGTERHESRRIDNQLRGRSGRQGDPGSSRFYVSLEDDLMRLFGSDRISGIMERLGWEEDMPIEHNQISRSIENAQKRVEARNFEIRKQVLQFDDVMNKQREVIYGERRKVLLGDNLRENMDDMMARAIGRELDLRCDEKLHPEEWDIDAVVERVAHLANRSPAEVPVDPDKVEDRASLQEQLQQWMQQAYAAREEEFGPELMREIERHFLLQILDIKWMEHLRAMDDLREGIHLRAHAQRDPLIEYQFEGYEMFQAMLESIQDDTIEALFRVRVQGKEGPREPAGVDLLARATARHGSGPSDGDRPRPQVQQRRVGRRVGRNEPCPCGSGKKYKHCCIDN